jgi:hypothetical protein
MTQVEFEFWFNLVFAMRRYMRGTQGLERASLQDTLLYVERKLGEVGDNAMRECD